MYKWYPINSVSHSSLNLLSMCPQKWFWSYVMKIKQPPGGATLVGSVGHATLEYASNKYIETGEWPIPELLDVKYNMEWDREWDKVKDLGINWNEETSDIMKAQGNGLVHVYMENPFIPEEVEYRDGRDLSGLFDTNHIKMFNGIIDLIDVHGNVIDHKFSTRKKYANEVDTDLQPYAYAFMLDEEIDFCFNELLRSKTRVKDPFANLRNERTWTRRNSRDIAWYREQFMPGLVMKADEIMTRIYEEHGNDPTWMEDTDYVQRLQREFPAVPNWSCKSFCAYRQPGMCGLQIQNH